MAKENAPAQKAEPTPAPRPTVAEIAANPLGYGFTFDIGKLHKKIGGTLTELPAQPFLRVVDTAKFESYFPGVQLKHQNGSSIKVHSQAIGRTMAHANRSVKREDVRAALVDQICFGATASTSSTVVEVIRKMTDAEAAGMVELLVAAGIPAAEALAKVEKVRNG